MKARRVNEQRCSAVFHGGLWAIYDGLRYLQHNDITPAHHHLVKLATVLVKAKRWRKIPLYLRHVRVPGRYAAVIVGHHEEIDMFKLLIPKGDFAAQLLIHMQMIEASDG